jgi:hypothetical protein
MPFDPSAVEAFQACSLGFAFAGVLASGFETITERKASFRLLQTGDLAALASVPILVFCAPFVLMRTAIRRRFERRPLHFVMPAMTVACLWSLMSGRLVLVAAQALAGS